MQTYCHVNPQIQQLLTRAIRRFFAPYLAQDIARCVPQLVDLLVESRDTPIEKLNSSVRSIVLASCQIDEGGDAAEHSSTGEMETGIFQLMCEMERLRHDDAASGSWCGEPVPPQMFG